MFCKQLQQDKKEIGGLGTEDVLWYRLFKLENTSKEGCVDMSCTRVNAEHDTSEPNPRQ